MNLHEDEVYQNHRIHTMRLPSGVWLVSLVKLGAPGASTRPYTGPPVVRVPGEYASEMEAVLVAKRYIDRGLAESGSDPTTR